MSHQILEKFNLIILSITKSYPLYVDNLWKLRTQLRDKMCKNTSTRVFSRSITFIGFKALLNVDKKQKIVYYYICRIMDNYPLF